MHIFHWFPFSRYAYHTQRNNVTDIFTFYSFGFFFVYNLFAFESLDIKHLRSYKYMRECMWYVMCIQSAYRNQPILVTTRHACVCFYVSIIAVVLSVTVLRIKIFFDSLAHNNNLLKSFFQIFFPSLPLPRFMVVAVEFLFVLLLSILRCSYKIRIYVCVLDILNRLFSNS